MAKILRNGLRVVSVVVEGDIQPSRSLRMPDDPLYYITVSGDSDDGQVSHSLEFDKDDAEWLLTWLASCLAGADADRRGSKTPLGADLRALARRADAGQLGPRGIRQARRKVPKPAPRPTATEQRRARKGAGA